MMGKLLSACFLFGLCLNAFASDQDTSRRPNIVIIYVDDLARGDVGAFGCPEPGTPNIDRLANEGVMLTNAFTINAPCSPSRTALMMGMYTQRFGKYDLSRGVPIPDDKPTMAETLRDGGYVTGIVGLEKWDIGKWDQEALSEGFMEASKQLPRKPPNGDFEDYRQASWYLGIDGTYCTEIEGDYCLEFIDRHAPGKKPFFLYYVPLAVHTPLHEVPEKYLKKLYPDHQGEYHPRQHLRATLFCLDIQIGRILDKLQDAGISENTLVIFSSDNGGDPSAEHRPLPFRGGKGGENRSNLQWEGNYRMPTILSFPGTLPAGATYDGMSSTMDFYATAVALAQTKPPGHLDGKNLIPLLTEKETVNPDEIYFWNTHGSEIARWQEWRLVRFRKQTPWRLYDIEKDPSETTNLADQHPEIVKQLASRYDQWLSEMADPAKPVKPPEALLPHTAMGRHARRPFGWGWITAETWNQIKDDPSQWSEIAARKHWLKQSSKDAPQR